MKEGTHETMILSFLLIGGSLLTAADELEPVVAPGDSVITQSRPEDLIAAIPTTSPNLEVIDVKLTGISTFPPQKIACFMTASLGQGTLHLTLAEGQQQGRLKLISVDENQKAVEVLIDGNRRRIAFETNGITLKLFSKGPSSLVEERLFAEAHIRAHEDYQRRELARTLRERARVIAELSARQEISENASEPEP